ncbi:carbon-nitrogen hydrolase family protein [Ciceribacter sp. L1K23]|uniref:carbon-nitrogen hydrolase family protein n=1 Tax=Ciceribacter sp. L1K23 TaxID=2820276 RepID=UPI001B83DE7D|nr:carbon-nitrogen hydrolase family protein [Ciceribacter sp. L1K23]MBR0558046.1 carbon-nitrogen hydrolase family protein [Ciceribacter sp. L1K23]
MRVSLLQMQPVSGDVAANLEKIGRAAKAASAMGATLLIAPELATSGYALGRRFEAVAEGRDGKTVETLSRLASDTGIAICVGFPESDGEVVYNSSVLVRPDGTSEFYRKGHLYGPAERAAFRPGSEQPVVFDLLGMKTAMIICYDVEFPEYVRTAALAGAELLLVPTALPVGEISRRIADQVVPTRALENGIFILYADLCGAEGETGYCGRSVIVGPDGDEIARAGLGETLLVADIDPAGYDECRRQNPYLEERRTELYRLG